MVNMTQFFIDPEASFDVSLGTLAFQVIESVVGAVAELLKVDPD